MATRDQITPDFIEDVEKRLQDEGTDDVNVLIGKLQHRYSIVQSAEHTVLQQRHRYQSKETYLKDTLACVRLMLQRREQGQDTIVDYSLSGVVIEASVQFGFLLEIGTKITDQPRDDVH
jgi:hypothetical protein